MPSVSADLRILVRALDRNRGVLRHRGRSTWGNSPHYWVHRSLRQSVRQHFNPIHQRLRSMNDYGIAVAEGEL
jgi:hypothetical protein